MALIKKASYNCYGPNRWIIMEGNPQQNMYLIVKGVVRIVEHKYNPAFKIMEAIEICKLYAKQSFGESAVMFDTLRNTSVQSLSKYFLLNIL